MAKTKADLIREWLQDNQDRTFDSCRQAWKAFCEEEQKVYYNNFRRIYQQPKKSKSGVSEEYQTEEREGPLGLPYKVWKNIPEEEDPIKNGEHYDRIWVAGYPSTKNFTLVSTHEKGEPQWPDQGGCTVIAGNTNKRRFFIAERCRLHPDTVKEKEKVKKKAKA